MVDLTGHWESTQWDWEDIDVDNFDDYDDPQGNFLVRDDFGPLNRFSTREEARVWMDEAVMDNYDLPLYLDDLDLELILETRE